jgi:hypothetical protein
MKQLVYLCTFSTAECFLFLCSAGIGARSGIMNVTAFRAVVAGDFNFLQAVSVDTDTTLGIGWVRQCSS